MISSASHSPGQPLPGSLAASAGPKTDSAVPVVKAAGVAQESLSAANTAALRNALGAIPEVRPEVVAKAKNLAADANYPPRLIIEKLAEMIAKSTDLTN